MSLRQNYSWLRFFNKNGEDLNFSYDAENDKWNGSIYIPRVSADLIEYEPVYILEEVWDGINNQSLGLRKPRKANLTASCPGATTTNIIANWFDETPGSTTDNVTEIFMWDITGFPGPEPTLTKYDELNIDLGDFTGDLVGPSGGGGTGQLVYSAGSITPFLNEAISLRVGIQSNEEGSYTRTLQLIDPLYLTEDPYDTFGCTGSTHVFCDIRYYGEVEGEDERLETMIENLGSVIQNSDNKIFDDVDINEALPDYIKLNTKRKELLLEFENIFPFTGAYKALINILKWFGYDQVTLKEYWLNIDELNNTTPEGTKKHRYKQTAIEDLFSTNPKTADPSTGIIPSKLYKKTSKFGLFYDITRDSGNFDDDGLPIVEEAFIFTNDEVLVKLYALKQKLKKYFLPLNAKIVDIVGEAVFYSLYDINIWSDLLRVDDVELNINPCVVVTPEDGCSLIKDLTADNFLGVKVPPDLNMAGISNFVSYAIGVTQSSTLGGDVSGKGDTYTITDTVSGRSIEYETPNAGQTHGEILDNIIDTWNSQIIEPWTQFTLAKEVGQDSLTGSTFASGYAWLYAVQNDIIGPTGGVNFVPGITGVPGPTSVFYTTIGTTSISYDYGSSALAYYASAFLGYFDGYDRSVDDLNDYPCAPIAAPFILENCSFELDWDEASVLNWNSLDYKNPGGTFGINYSYFDYSYTQPSYPLGSTNPYSGLTGITYSGPSGGTTFGGATPGNALHPPGPTFVTGFDGSTGPDVNPIMYDWVNVGYRNFFEMEWTIIYDQDPTWKIESGLLSLEDGKTFPILLPYVGTYTIDLKLYDHFGSVSRYYETSKLCVDAKQIDFIGHYKSRECNYTWDDKTILRQSETYPAPSKDAYPDWDVYNSNWNLPLQENEEFRMQDLTYNDLDRIEFYQTQNDPQYQGFCDEISTNPLDPGATGSTGLNDLESYRWNLIENNATWEDVCHLWWEGIGPKMTQIRVDSPTIDTSTIEFGAFVIAEEPLPLNSSKQFAIYKTLTEITGLTSVEYGDIAKNIDPGATGTSNVYQYFYGSPSDIGATGGTSGFPNTSTGATGPGWIEQDYIIDHILLPNPNSFTGATAYKEIVRLINEGLQDTPNDYPIFNDLLVYYNEEYIGATNALDPFIQFVSKDSSTNKKYHLRYQGPEVANYYPQLPIFTEGASVDYVDAYQTVNFGDMGDIPGYFEIIATGASGGTLYLPGPTTLIDAFGNITTGTTHWPYEIGSTSLTDLWQQLTYMSQGQAPTGPSAGASATGIKGPILDYEWNVVYGASGYTGSTTSFPPPSGLVPIKIQGSKSYFSSNDYECVKFGPIGIIGATDSVLGGTSGFAGTMCSRSIIANSDWNTLRIHKYAKEFPLLTQIQFNYSLSSMSGKTSPRWKLIKENDSNWVNIYYNNPYFSYTFTQKGSYTLELQITDNQGNIKTKTKKEFVKII